MRLGFPNYPRADVLEQIEWIAANGFDFVDLFLEPDCAAIGAFAPAQVRGALDRLGLGATGHLAWYLPIGSPMDQLRRAAVEIAREYLGVFAEVGVPAVTIHSHWPPGMFTAEEGVRWQINSLRQVLGAASALGLHVMYEPVGAEFDRPEHLAAVLDALPALLCHLDMGHCNLFGLSPSEMIARFAGRLHHVHLHDNDGRADLHLPPGAGTIDWRAVVGALKDSGYDGTITLEVFSRDRDYVLLGKRKIEMLWQLQRGPRT